MSLLRHATATAMLHGVKDVVIQKDWAGNSKAAADPALVAQTSPASIRKQLRSTAVPAANVQLVLLDKLCSCV